MLMTRIGNTSLRRLRAEERGQGLVEYALIIALVGLASIVALGFLSGKINTLFSKAGNSLNNVPVAAGSVTGGTSTTGGPAPTAPTSTGAPSLSCSDNPCEDSEQGPDDTLSTTNGSWNDGGSAITGYTYAWWSRDDQNNDFCPSVTTTPAAAGYSSTSGSSSSLDPPDLNNDRCYVVTVVATNGVGPSSAASSNPVHVND
jgi:pilus assembly protein Flp/PilA